jgi:hypothetical protein
MPMRHLVSCRRCSPNALFAKLEMLTATRLQTKPAKYRSLVRKACQR